MALTLSVGFVVDDAIVMLENIVRHMEKGEDAVEAALDGLAEIGFTILSMTLSLAAVFIPVLFMGGIVGRLFREFAVTIGAGHPGLRFRLAQPDADALQPLPAARALEHHGRFYNASERVFNGILAVYEWSLRIVLRHRRLIHAGRLSTLFLTYWLFKN